MSKRLKKGDRVYAKFTYGGEVLEVAGSRVTVRWKSSSMPFQYDSNELVKLPPVRATPEGRPATKRRSKK